MKKKIATALALVFASLVGFSQSNCIEDSLINIDAICPTIFLPVCGCNGITYSNACEAVNYGGVTSYTDGVCQFQDSCINQYQLNLGQVIDCVPSGPSLCGCDGMTYHGECEAYYYGGVTTYSWGACDSSMYCPKIPTYVQFGDCDMALGWARTINGCQMMSGCSTIGDNGFNYSAYFFPSEYQCNSGCDTTVVIECFNPSQVDSSMMCLALWDPVCGCDNVTYSNSCVAYYYGGVSITSQGECGLGINELQSEDWSLAPNPTSGIVNLKISGSFYGTLNILDNTGRKIAQHTVVGQTNHSIDLSQYPRGMYLIQLIGRAGDIDVKKVVLE